MFYQPDGPGVWVLDAAHAKRFDHEDLAIETIVRDLDGDGRTVALTASPLRES